MRSRPLSLLLALFLASAASASATQYYVSPTGSDANDGSIGNPWLTITHALNSSGPGDTVNLRTGTYAGDIEMRGDYGHEDHGIYVLHGTNKIVRNNRINNTSGYGVHVYDERKQVGDPQTFLLGIVVEGNTIDGSRLRSGIIVSQGGDTQIDGVIVRNNVVRSNQQFGISVPNYGSLNLRNVRIYNNTLYRNAAGGVLASGNVEAAEIKNNIVWSDPGVMHLEKQGPLPLTVSHNLYWTAPPRLVNLVDSNPVVGDPMFVNASGGDFHQPVSSPPPGRGLRHRRLRDDPHTRADSLELTKREATTASPP